MIEYVITVGPASRPLSTLMQLIEQGATILRLNFSHGTHEWYTELFRDIVMLKAQYPHIKILADISGPSLRILTPAEATVAIKNGDLLTFSKDPADYRLTLDVLDQLPVESKLIFGEGYGTARIIERTGEKVILQCEGNFEVKNKMHLHTNAHLKSEAITEKDWKDLAFVLDKPIDLVALSFIQDSKPIITVKEYLNQHDKKVLLMSKIETQAAVDNIDEITTHSDMLMVARGDLALEAELVELPDNQERIINAGRKQQKPVIVATQMLFSMVKNPMPTRAEINDIALAIRQGASGLMLSDETTVGEHPTKALNYLKQISEASLARMVTSHR
jgi:pyruvate kinase